MKAAAIPFSARAAIRISIEGASAQKSEARVKPAIPALKAVTTPKRSAMAPPVRISAESVRR